MTNNRKKHNFRLKIKRLINKSPPHTSVWKKTSIDWIVPFNLGPRSFRKAQWATLLRLLITFTSPSWKISFSKAISRPCKSGLARKTSRIRPGKKLPFHIWPANVQFRFSAACTHRHLWYKKSWVKIDKFLIFRKFINWFLWIYRKTSLATRLRTEQSWATFKLKKYLEIYSPSGLKGDRTCDLHLPALCST